MVLHLSKVGYFRRSRVLLLLFAVGFTYFYLLPTDWTGHMNRAVIEVDKWLENPYTGCNDHFTGYGNEFAWLRNARFDKTKKSFSIPCEKEIPKYTFLHGKEGTVLQQWMDNLQTFPNSEVSNRVNSMLDTTTVVVMRFEAHNLYHTLCEWYNVFIVSRLLKLNPSNVNILFMDDRPSGLMDDTWDVLFGNISRYPDLPRDAVFRNLIWNILGYESPMNFHNLISLPYAEEFHNFFIRSFGVSKQKPLNCKKLDVTVILRKDYITHPERQKETGGLVHRKFKNEDEILQIVKDIFKDHSVKDAVLEKMNMKDQVDLFTNTDIMIGMHGAGMAHTMFLPKHAAVFETFPNYWGFLRHFKAFARWRGIKYLGWQNSDRRNEYNNFYTRIPPEVLQSHLQQLKSYLCPS